MTHGADTWKIRVDERHKLNVMELKFLRSMCTVTRMDRLRNAAVRYKVGAKEKIGDIMVEEGFKSKLKFKLFIVAKPLQE